MADWFFTVNGCRNQVDIEFVTPLDNVFTKPVAAKTLAEVASRKNIKVTPYFDLAQVNASEKTIESHKGQKVSYDLLVSIPPNLGDKVLIDSVELPGSAYNVSNCAHYSLICTAIQRECAWTTLGNNRLWGG